MFACMFAYEKASIIWV